MSYLGQQLGQGQAERFVFTASGGETSVTTADDGRAIAYTVGQVDVYLNGAKLINGSDFTATTGTSITGLSALTASDVVEVFALSIFQASDTVSAASGGTFNGNVTVDANLSVTGTVDIDTSLNVDGTVTADGLTVDGNATLQSTGDVVFNLNADTDNSGEGDTPEIRLSQDGGLYYSHWGQEGQSNTKWTGSTSNTPFIYSSVGFQIATNANSTAQTALTVGSTGDISFYEDTGTTPKFFWDASEEKLSLGSTSFAGYGPLQLGSTSATSANSTLQFLASSTAASYIQFGDTTSATDGRYSGYIGYLHGDDAMRFATSATEAMRIDSSGNLLVGTTSSSTDTAGIKLRADLDLAAFTKDGGHPLQLNRLTSDGDIILFRKDGTTVGSIGTEGGDLVIGTGDTGLQFVDSIDAIRPFNITTNADRDAAVDLGVSYTRFKDLYLSGGVYLGGTAAANHLDDYEEGTWTLTVNGVSGLTVKSAKYVKIGRAVHIDVRATWTSAGGAGNLSFSLPFPTPSSPEPAQTGIVFYSGTAIRSGTPLSTHIGQSNTAVTFYITSGGNFSNISPSEVNGSYDWLFSLTYFTDA